MAGRLVRCRVVRSRAKRTAELPSSNIAISTPIEVLHDQASPSKPVTRDHALNHLIGYYKATRFEFMSSLTWTLAPLEPRSPGNPPIEQHIATSSQSLNQVFSADAQS
jgi:hypothetical protein